jgi:multidrug efflux pump subunit AcrA (membrane-fusion protein)
MRVSHRLSLRKALTKNPRRTYAIALVVVALLLLIRLPLRIVAPCEIVSSHPYPIRAPLEGVVKEIVVKPGEWVNKDDLLLLYENQVQKASLQSAEKQLLAKELELQRAAVLGWKDEQLQNELAILKAQKQKEEASLKFTQYEVGLLEVKSPIAGVAVIDSPEDWRGRPVKAGEKILTVSDPNHTKVKIWIPESDNVPLDPAKAVKIFLNTAPSYSYAAQIEYISNEASINENEIPSFVAMANWTGDQPTDAKLGLKGSAVLYGESVSLFYYILRRPWYALRNLIGV